MKTIKQLIIPLSLLLLVLFFGYTLKCIPPDANYEYRWKCQRLNCTASAVIVYDNSSRPTTNVPDCTVQAGSCLLARQSMKILGESKTGEIFYWYCSRNGTQNCPADTWLCVSGQPKCYNSDNGKGGWVMTDTNNAPLIMCDVAYVIHPEEGPIYFTCDLELELVTR